MTNDVISLASSIIDDFGPRIATTEPCMKAAGVLLDDLKGSCDRAYEEEFLTQPKAINNFLRWMIVCHTISLVLTWLNLPQIAVFASFFAVFVFVGEYLLFREVIDRFGKSEKAKNVYGVIEPEEEVKNVVIFSGHHDSIYIFNYYIDYPQLWLVREVIFVLVITSLVFYTGYLDVVKLMHGTFFAFEKRTRRDYVVLIVYTLLLRMVFPLWFYLNEKGTPGAGDNLVSSVMSVVLARRYAKNRPKHTRLIFASFDGEELTLRGSRAFFKRHKKEFHEVKTWNFNVDCPYFVDEIKFLKSDINGFQPLSERLANECVRIAHELGYERAYSRDLMFLTGGTDAAEAARNGIEATTMLGVPFSHKDTHGNDVVYHTDRDTIDHVEPAVLTACMQIFMKLVDRIEQGSFGNQ